MFCHDGERFLNIFLDLSFQAAQRVMSTDGDVALDVLQDISQNLPSKARYIFDIMILFELFKHHAVTCW